MNDRDKMLNCIKLSLALILLMAARYFIADFEIKDFTLYGVFFVLYVVHVFNINCHLYSVLCVLCGATITAIFGLKTTVCLLPLLVFLLLVAVEEQINDKMNLKSIYLFFIALFEPALIVASFATDMKDGILAHKNQWNLAVIVLLCCFFAVTVVLLYWLKLKTGSEKKRNKNWSFGKTSQYTFLMATFIEAMMFFLFSQLPYYYVVIMSDLWLGLVFVLSVSREMQGSQRLKKERKAKEK